MGFSSSSNMTDSQAWPIYQYTPKITENERLPCSAKHMIELEDINKGQYLDK